MNYNELPKDWKWEKLGKVATYLNGRAFKPSEWKEEGKPIIRIQNLNKPDAKYNYTNEEYEERYKVVKGDLLFAWSASLGAYIWKGSEAWLNQHIFKVVPKDNSDKTYLFYLLEKLVQELYSKAHGSGMVHVTKGKFEATEIPLPPLPTQLAIVSKIEELFSELDKGIEQLKTAQQQLKTYRQAVLKWAFEGKLTNENVKVGELPEGWKWVKLGEFIRKIEAGKSFKCDERPPRRSEIGILKVSAVTWDEFDEEESKTVLDKSKINESYFVKKGDFLLSRANTIELVGKSVIVKAVNKKVMLSDKTLRIIFNDLLINYYVLYFLRCRKGRQQIEQLSSGNQESMRNIGQERLKQIEIPYCSINEQKRIISEIESRLSMADKMEDGINNSLQQAEALRQSILKKAFEGRLI